MFRAELPSSVSIEYNPKNFGAGTTTNRLDDTDVIEEHYHRRKAGTNRHRKLHVRQRSSQQVTSLKLTPGKDYQDVLIQQQGAEVVHSIGVNHTHVLIKVLKPKTGETLREAKYTWSGDKVEMEPHPEQPPLGFYEDTQSEVATPLSQDYVPPSLDLPCQLFKDKATFLHRAGEKFRDMQNYMNPSEVITLSTILVDHVASVPAGHQLPLEM